MLGRRGWFLSGNVAPSGAAESLPQLPANLLPPSQGEKFKLVCFKNFFCKDNGKTSICDHAARADRGAVCAGGVSAQAKQRLPSPGAEDAAGVVLPAWGLKVPPSAKPWSYS